MPMDTTEPVEQQQLKQALMQQALAETQAEPALADADMKDERHDSESFQDHDWASETDSAISSASSFVCVTCLVPLINHDSGGETLRTQRLTA